MTRATYSLRKNEIAGLALIGVLALATIGWAARSELAGAVIATGAVAVKDNSKDVQHNEGGIVREIMVAEGDIVAAGTVVARIDDTQIRAKLGIVESQIVEMTAEQARLMAERDNTADIAPFEVPSDYAAPGVLERAIEGQRKHLASIRETQEKKKAQLREQISQVRSNIGGLEAKVAATEKQIALGEAEFDVLKGLMDKGLTTRNRIFAMERELVQLRGQADDERANLASLKAQVAEREIKILEVDEARRAEVTGRLSDVRAKLADMHEQRNFELFRLRGTAIVAPIAGRIHNLKIHTKDGVVAPREILMTVVPSEEAIVFRVRVRPQDMDRVYAGQPARLRFPAFNSKTTPEFEGSVAVVGADQMVDQATGVPYFRVDISANPEAFKGFDMQRVKPGLPTEAYITTEPQTVLSYLLKPLTDQFAKAMRES